MLKQCFIEMELQKKNFGAKSINKMKTLKLIQLEQNCWV